jgi:hypothetical protein
MRSSSHTFSKHLSSTSTKTCAHGRRREVGGGRGRKSCQLAACDPAFGRRRRSPVHTPRTRPTPRRPAHLDQVQDAQLRLGVVDGDDKVERRVVPVDELSVLAKHGQAAGRRARVAGGGRCGVRGVSAVHGRQQRACFGLSACARSPAALQEVAHGVRPLGQQREDFPDNRLLLLLVLQADGGGGAAVGSGYGAAARSLRAVRSATDPAGSARRVSGAEPSGARHAPCARTS